MMAGRTKLGEHTRHVYKSLYALLIERRNYKTRQRAVASISILFN